MKKTLKRLAVFTVVAMMLVALPAAGLADIENEAEPDAENSRAAIDIENPPAAEDIIIDLEIKDEEGNVISGLTTDVFEVSATGPGEISVSMIHEIHVPGSYIIVAQYDEAAEEVDITVEVKGVALEITGINFVEAEDFYTSYSAEESSVVDYEDLLVEEEAQIDLKFITEEEEEVAEGDYVKFFVEYEGPVTWFWLLEGAGNVFDKVEGEVMEVRALVGEEGLVSALASPEEPGDVDFTFYQDHDGEEGTGLIGTASIEFIEEVPVIGAERVDFFIGETTYLVDGVEEEMDVAPFIRDDRTFIPVRFIAEALGAEADYEPKDAAVETVTLDREDLLVTIEMGEYVLEVLDKEKGVVDAVPMEVASFIEDGRTFLPFRFIAEAFGSDVNYSTDPDTGRTDQVWFTQEPDPEALQPIPEADPRIGESVVEGEILAVDKENRQVEIEIHWGPDTPDIEPVITVADDALLRLYVDGYMEEALSMCDLEEGMITSYILEEDLEARAVIVHEYTDL